jgi:hypothetical protein
VFLDADTLVVAPVDDLFTRDELSASPDQGWYGSAAMVHVSEI